MSKEPSAPNPAATIDHKKTVMGILIALSVSHMLNDLIQAILPSIYPLIKNNFNLNFAQIGLITFTFQCTASLLQPLVGIYTDLKPKPFSLAAGMSFTLVGIGMLAFASDYRYLIIAAAMIGVGSAVFHPEASRVAKLASGGKFGFAQSLFQVGGNFGSAIGPLLAAAIVIPHGQLHVLWFSILAFIGIIVLSKVGQWYRDHLIELKKTGKKEHIHLPHGISRGRVIFSILILMSLIFSKYFYLVSLSNYFTFYLISKFGVSVQTSQVFLFIFLFSVAAGTIIGGPVGDRIGRKYVIWASILGVAPFTLILPYMNLVWTVILTVPIGIILASAMSAILVYAQELLPGRTGLISGLFFGFAFGMGGLGAALLGRLADQTSIEYVYRVCAYLPLIGLLTVFLPNFEQKQVKA
ncbi:MAG: MFS transporter [Verrucomicrobiota bacterium]|jgi:FSR family fosmidomycin resistance protein-like MFS transporter